MKTLSFYGILLTIIMSIASCTESDSDVYGSIYGRVTDANTNEPVGGASVNLTPNGNTVVTGDDGTFEYKNLESGQYDIQVSKTGYQTIKSTVTVGAGKITQNDIKIPTESFKGVFGYVKDEETQAVISGATIRLDPLGYTVTTSGDGRYEFKNLETGEYTLRTSKNGYQTDSRKIKIEANNSMQVDVPLFVGVGSLRIDNANIDFEKNNSTLACNIRNTGTSTLSWEIPLYSCEWIKSISPMSGTLGQGGKASIIITVDRTKLTDESPKATELIINSDGGSSIITVTINKDPAGGGEEDPQVVVTDNLTAYYTFDNDGSSDLIKNWANNKLDGRIINNPELITQNTPNGKGKALFIKATESQLFRTATSPLVGGSTESRVYEFSVNFWIKDFESGMIFSLVDSNSSYRCYPYFYIDSNTAMMDVMGESYNSMSRNLGEGIRSYQNGKWHMVTYTYNKGMQKLYVDNVLYGNDIIGHTYQPLLPNGFHFGGNAGLSKRKAISMKLDNIRFYTRELTEEDIQAIYYSEKQ